MKSLWSAVLSWYRATPLNVTCMEAPCINTGWVLSCHSSLVMPGFSDLNMNSIRWVSPGRITPWMGGEAKRKAGLSTGWKTRYDGMTNIVWRKSGASRCLIMFACTRGALEIEARTLCLWSQVTKAAWHEKPLPVVEDGCAALILQLQVGWDSFSSQGLKDYCGADSYFSLIDERWRAGRFHKSKRGGRNYHISTTAVIHSLLCYCYFKQK